MIIVFLVVIGVGDVLMETFTGPVAHGVERLTTAFATVLIAEVPGILTIGFAEEILEKTTKRKFEYSTDRARPIAHRARREPGSNVPLPPGAPFPSIYNLDLPIPSPGRGQGSTAAPAPTCAAAPLSERITGSARDHRFQRAASDHRLPEREPRPAPESAPLGPDPRATRAAAHRRTQDQPPPEHASYRRPERPLTRRAA